MVSGEENMSRRNNQEKEPLVEATAIKAPAQGDITEVKKMLETFLTKQNKQAKIIEATSKELKALSRRKRERPDTARLRARVDPQRLDFSAPRTTRGNPEDLPPPPPPRRETDKSPERIMDISDEEEPAPTKRTRAEGAEGSRQEPRASDTQSASGSSKTEIVKDTSEYTNYSSEEWYKKEQERRAFKRSYVAELAAVKAQMDRVTSDLKRTQSQIHHGTGKAPAIAQQEMSLNTPTTIQDALHRAADFARTEEEVQATKGGKTKQGTLKTNNSLSDFKPQEKAPANTEQQVDTPRHRRRDDGMENEDQHEVINMIMGGSQYCADNETAIEAYQCRADVCVNISAPAKPRLSNDPITFNEKDTEGLNQPHNNPLVINLTIYNFNVARVLIDRGSSVDVIFKKTLERMKIHLSTIKGRPKPITGFSGETTMTMGTIRLPVQAGNIKKMVDFIVFDHPDESCAFNIPLMPQIPNFHRQLKEYLATPPILAKPVTGEPLFLYIDVSETPVSAVLAREERGEQKPIFYVSKTLIDAETRYPQLEKLALSVVMASRKLRPYFQSHTIIILSTFPLRSVLHSPSQSGGLAKWVVELSEYDIEYKGRTCNKSQVLVDFLIELPEDQTTKEVRPEIWELHVEGSSSKNGSGIGIRLASPTCEILEQSFRLGFRASNNEAEYEAIIARIRLAQGLNIKHVHALCDSQLLASQFSGEYAKAMAETRVKDVTMTEAKADTELTPLTMTPTTDADVIRVEVIEADVTDADVVRTEVPDDLGQPEDLSTQNLPLEPKDKDTTIPMDTNEEPEYGCDKSWIDQFALISLTESSLTASGQPARDKRPVKSWRKYTAGLVAITQEAKP
ncbi:hypothetical protein AALP_AA2G084100 [Arabis alpina]|uniref:Reverse transcriptase/retrotransposon-derived protein RNase H-like domain-containing protein n=1 Tax=Arabis alpina TaxID=50452 RepID=A0A087HG33_ARAAL|nr:hypothetical protein AALP_AA2G084100 [Arabis alpina]